MVAPQLDGMDDVLSAAGCTLTSRNGLEFRSVGLAATDAGTSSPSEAREVTVLTDSVHSRGRPQCTCGGVRHVSPCCCGASGAASAPATVLTSTNVAPHCVEPRVESMAVPTATELPTYHTAEEVHTPVRELTEYRE